MKILKNKLLFILCFIFLMIPSVNAETNYYNDDSEMFRLVFDDTPLRNFVKNDFAITYNEIDLQGYEIAKLTSTGYNGKYTFINGFAKDKDLNIMIFETSKEWQVNNNEKYIAVILPDYIAGNTNSTQPKIYENIKLVKREESGTFYGYYYKGNYYYLSSYGVNQLNFNKSSAKIVSNALIPYGGGNTELIISVDKDGNIMRRTDLYNVNNSLAQEIIGKSNRNLIYSSSDVYNNAGTQIIIPKEEFIPKRNTPHADYSLGCDENNPFIYNIYFNIDFLEKNDNVKIYKEDKLLKDIKYVYEPNETETITIENAETGYYKIDVFDENNDLLYSENFHIDVKIGDIFDENDTPTSLLDKIKMYLKGFKKNINMFYEGFENFFSSLNFELRTGIFIITTIFIIVYIIKIIL